MNLKHRLKVRKSRAFTLIEMIVSSTIFLMGMFIAAQVYLNLVKSVLFAQTLQTNIDNVRYGLEKIWSELKSGTNFTTTTYNPAILEFKDRKCRSLTIRQEDQKLIMDIAGATSSIFDEKLVEVINFKYFFSTLTDPNNTDYTIYSRKFVSLNLELNLKTPNGYIPFKIRTSVAPLTSPKSQNIPCP